MKLVLWPSTSIYILTYDAAIGNSSKASWPRVHKVDLPDTSQEVLFNKSVIFEFDNIYCGSWCAQCVRPFVAED